MLLIVKIQDNFKAIFVKITIYSYADLGKLLVDNSNNE